MRENDKLLTIYSRENGFGIRNSSRMLEIRNGASEEEDQSGNTEIEKYDMTKRKTRGRKTNT